MSLTSFVTAGAEYPTPEPNAITEFNTMERGSGDLEQSFDSETRSLASLETLPEKQLVRMAQSGDGGAFDELIRRHHRDCMKRALHIVRDPSDAKDQVQEAYCKAFTSIEQFRGEGTFGAWVSRIVENQCLMTFRKPRVHFLRLESPSEANVQIELISQGMNPEDRLGSEEVNHLLVTEVRKLPPIMRDIVVLYDLGSQTLPEVASQLGISVPAAKSRLARARLELRSRIAKHMGKKGPASLTQRAGYGQLGYSAGAFRSAGSPRSI